MKKYINKKSIIITSVVLLLLVAIETTLAYIFTKTEPVENTFKPSKVSCAVVENGTEDEYTNKIVETGKTKEKVKIKNTGDTDAYIRVAVVVNWANKDGTMIWAQKPEEGIDYELKLNLTDGWFKGEDDFYYYSKAVSPDDLTSILINEAKQLTEDTVAPEGTDDTQYYISIEIVASAIQSTPKNVVEEQWGVKVDENGTLIRKGN